MIDHSVKRKLDELLWLVLNALHTLLSSKFYCCRLLLACWSSCRTLLTEIKKSGRLLLKQCMMKLAKPAQPGMCCNGIVFWCCLSYCMLHVQSNRAGQGKRAS